MRTGTQGEGAGEVRMRQTSTAETFMYLTVVGSLMPGPQMRGEMAPEVVGGATNAGSWDFAPR